jgi:EmrB/QacA subfamily drug resistance transporter
VTRATPSRALVLGALTSFMVGLDALVVTTALPTIRRDFAVDAADLSWSVNAFALAFAAAILTGSALGDRYGRRRVFIVGILGFTLASALCALSPTFGWLVAARALQGLGGGVAVPLALAMLTDATPPERRGRVLGIWGAVTGIAVAAGPLIGGLVVQNLDWQWIFWMNLPIGLVVAVAATGLPEGRGIRRRLDVIGVASSTIGVFLISQGLIRGNGVGWGDPTVSGGIAVGIVALVGFAIWERRTAHPLMPPGMFRIAGFAAGCIATFVLTAGLFGMAYLTSQYLQLGLGLDPFGVGLGLLPLTGLALIVSPIAGRLADRVGEGPLVAVGLALQGTGFVLIALVAVDAGTYSAMIAPLIIAGIGIAIAFPTVTTAVMRAVAPDQAAVASGMSNTFRQVGAVFGVAVAVATFTAFGSLDSPGAFAAGYRPAMLVLGILALAAAATGFFMRRGRAGAAPDRVVESPRVTAAAADPAN